MAPSSVLNAKISPDEYVTTTTSSSITGFDPPIIDNSSITPR